MASTSALGLLKAVAKKPYLGFKSLKEGEYEILSFRLVKNKQFKGDDDKKKLKRVLLVELDNQVLFLPEYFATPFNDDDSKIEELNNDGVRKFLYFGGGRPNSHGGQ